MHQLAPEAFQFCVRHDRRTAPFDPHIAEGQVHLHAWRKQRSFHFSVKALTEIQITGMRRAEVQARLAINPDILTALAKSWIAETEAADRAQTALGQCSAEERIAYLLLHLTQQIAARSVIREQRYPLPLRQKHIADAIGLTAVHVSRVLSLFRDRGIVELSDGVLQVFNLPELQRIGSLN